MLKIIRNFLHISMLLVLMQACAPARAATLDPNLIQTAIAGTSAAAATQTAQASFPLIDAESPTPTVTRAPSMTPFPTFTPVSIVMFTPQVRVSRNTNCRTGPGEVYDKVGALLVGDTAEVVGRSADAQYWIIRNPNRPSQLCWLSGRYATVTGAAGALPVFTPPPPPTATRTPTRVPTPTRTRTLTPVPSAVIPSLTPTPAVGFTASYINMENCPGTGWWLDIQLQNTGEVAFESMFIGVRDTVTDRNLYLNLDDFIDRNCSGSDILDNLPAGTTHIVSSSIFDYDLTGHALQAAITLCSKPIQSGTCISQIIDITP